jgi:acyl carrier protein
LALFITRNKYRRQRNQPLHPLLRAPTMNLAPNFPEDSVMQQLLQLLHEEIGLPKHKTIRLQTSINFDLGCDGSEAKQLMDALEQEFALDLGDFDTYRYFNPPGFDVFLKRRAKGRGEKVPLTIGMLYLAIKTHRWDTQTLENLS